MRVKTFGELANRIGEFTEIHVEENNRLNISNRLFDAAVRALETQLSLSSAINGIIAEIANNHVEMNLVNLRSTSNSWSDLALFGFLGIQIGYPFLLTEYGFDDFYDDDDYSEGIRADFGDLRIEIFGKENKYAEWDIPCGDCKDFAWRLVGVELVDGEKNIYSSGNFKAKDFETYFAKVKKMLDTQGFAMKSILPAIEC